MATRKKIIHLGEAVVLHFLFLLITLRAYVYIHLVKYPLALKIYKLG